MDTEMRNPKSVTRTGTPYKATHAGDTAGLTRAAAVIGGLGLFGAACLFNRRSAQKAEQDNPPTGSFVEVDGVRLHYVSQGTGRPLVLLHGNGVTLQDWAVSGLLSRAVAAGYRVIAFDRPGFGYSTRPAGQDYAPRDQARLFARALDELGVRQPIVLGHSWGAMVALGLALDHPQLVGGLVLLSGYYFPTVRVDAMSQYPTAAPVIGAALSHSVTPLLARLFGPAQIRMAFSPDAVPDRFAEFPAALATRPSQLRTVAIEGATMVAGARSLRNRYGELAMPVIILAGDGDRIAFPERHAARLHDAVPRSELRILPGHGHMLHHVAPDEVMAAIDRAGEGLPSPKG